MTVNEPYQVGFNISHSDNKDMLKNVTTYTEPD